MIPICKVCNNTFSSFEGNFNIHKTNKTGYNNMCKVCQKEYYRKYRLKKKDELKYKNAYYYLRKIKKSEVPKSFLAIRREQYYFKTLDKKLSKYLEKINWKEKQTKSYRDMIVW